MAQTQNGNHCASIWNVYLICMAQSLIIHGLVEKHSEISGVVADLEELTRQARASLAHIDAVIRLLDPDADIDSIKPKRPANRRSGLFGNGEISRRIREAIRDAVGPIAAEDVVRQAMIDKGLSPDDKMARQGLIRSFLWALHRMHVSGTVAKIGHGLGARWTAP